MESEDMHRVARIRWLLWMAPGLLLVHCGPAAADEGTWVELAVHPQASRQPTAWGKSLHTLCAWNGKLYAGYGDYDKNTGPISILSFDPVTRTLSNEWTSMTESITVFRPLLGRLYAPAIDPRGRAPKAAGYAVCDSSGQWSDNPVFMEHAFDVATLTGSDLWLVGSYGDEHSMALRSLDGGVTWQKALDLFRKGDNSSRFYYVGVLDKKLYLQSSSDTNSMVFHGEGWTHGPPIARFGYHPVTFVGKMVLQSGRDLLVFDGEKPAVPLLPQNPVRAFCTSVRALYVLRARDSTIQRTTDLSTWSSVATAPSNACSLAVLHGRLYTGTRDSRLYEYGRPISGETAEDSDQRP
jgi:hypothetical protein